jgi:D-alanine-D-alanine ligase
MEEATRTVGALASEMSALGHQVSALAVARPNLEDLLEPLNPKEILVFNWCEELPGLPHSDAAAAGTLESLGFTYTGAPPSVLSLSWDKAQVKRLLNQRGVATPRWRTFERPSADGWDCYPAIVKPAHEHFSLGLTPQSVVLNPNELRERVTHVLDAFRQPALVEDFIDGREFHISLWGNGTVEMLPPAEMDFGAFDDIHDRLCTFDSKFCPGSRHYDEIKLRVPAPLHEHERAALRRTALEAYFAIGCRDYARLDIRLRDGVFYVLDVNPNPDISPDASMACAAEVAGYSYGRMGSHLIEIAFHRHPRFIHD